jgi:DNA ligase D
MAWQDPVTSGRNAERTDAQPDPTTLEKAPRGLHGLFTTPRQSSKPMSLQDDPKVRDFTRTREAASGEGVRTHRRIPVSTLTKSAAGMPGAKKGKPSTAFFPPQLARLRETPPQGEAWLHEVKWDGYRILTGIADGEVSVWSRNGLAWNERIPEIVQAIEALGLDSARLDGELIAVDAQGRSDFNALQKTLSGEAQAPLVYMLFDMPFLQGYDLSRAALADRKALLERLLAHAPSPLGYSGHNVGEGDAVFAMAMKEKLEGIISKRVDGGYHSGRNDDWLKIKRLEADEFAVVGYTPAKGSRVSFGSLLLAKPGRKRGHWTYVGRVGTGFTDEMLHALGKSLAKAGKKTPPVPLEKIDPLLRGALWVEPTAVAEVYYRGIGNQGLLRQPSLKTLRIDKSPKDLRDSDRAPAPAASTRSGKKKTTARTTTVDADDITITHPDRVVYPDDGITKQDVADYYKAVMPWFLPPIADRPMPMLRCPGGIGEHCFFQKHMIAGLKHVGSAKLKEETGAQAVYLYPKDEAGLLELVQFGAIEFHPWGSHVKTPDAADRVIFDLDPGENVAWKRVVAAARMVRDFSQATGPDLVRAHHGRQGPARRGPTRARGGLGERAQLRPWVRGGDGTGPSTGVRGDGGEEGARRQDLPGLPAQWPGRHRRGLLLAPRPARRTRRRAAALGGPG